MLSEGIWDQFVLPPGTMTTQAIIKALPLCVKSAVHFDLRGGIGTHILTHLLHIDAPQHAVNGPLYEEKCSGNWEIGLITTFHNT